jgi:hypothetical protein
LDYARGEYLVRSLIQQLKDLRNEQAFKQIHDQAKELCQANHIDLLEQHRCRRQIAIPTRFQDCVIDSTLGHRVVMSSASDFMDRLYLPLIDCMLVELNDRFSRKTLSLLKSISTVYPESENFLNGDAVIDFCKHINVNANLVKNEFIVIQPLIQSKKITDVIGFLNELIPLSSAFPQTINMIRGAITMPVSQVTCERSFSKLKIIKNYLRNTMTDQRLSNLTLLAIERDVRVDYDRVIDRFSINHKNSRILLR